MPGAPKIKHLAHSEATANRPDPVTSGPELAQTGTVSGTARPLINPQIPLDTPAHCAYYLYMHSPSAPRLGIRGRRDEMKYRITIGAEKEPVEFFDDYDAATDRAEEIGRAMKTDVFVRDESGYSVADYDREADMVFGPAQFDDEPAPARPKHKKWGVAMCDSGLGDDLWSLVARHRNRRSAERYAKHRNRTCQRVGVEYIAVQYITNARYDENGAIVYSMDQDIVLVDGVPPTRNGRAVRLSFSWLPPEPAGDYE